MVTYYVVLAYQEGKNGYPVPDEPREVPSPGYAVALCQRLIDEERMAVVAFSRSGDPDTGDWADAEIIYQEGSISDDMLAGVA